MTVDAGQVQSAVQGWLEDLARRVKSVGNELLDQTTRHRMQRDVVNAHGHNLRVIADEIQKRAKTL